MNKQEFLQLLETELAGVSTDERVAALQYFTMYFEDAGSEQEAEVIAELGSPQKIAADIRATSSSETGEGWTPPPRVKSATDKPAATATSPAFSGNTKRRQTSHRQHPTHQRSPYMERKPLPSKLAFTR